MNRLWIITPEVVLRSKKDTFASYDAERREYYESPDGGTRFDDHKVVRQVEYTEGEYSVNLHIETIENVPVEIENYRRISHTIAKYDDNTPRTDRGVFEDIDIINDVKCFKYEKDFPVEFRERGVYETFTSRINVPLKVKGSLYYAPIDGKFDLFPVKIFLERDGHIRRSGLCSFDEGLYPEERVLVEFINSVKEELGEELI